MHEVAFRSIVASLRSNPVSGSSERPSHLNMMEKTMNTANTTARNCFDARQFVLATLAAACMAVGSTAVQAAEKSSESEPVKTVPFGDLNLANPQGVERLYRRIVAAAQQVCDTREGRSLQAQSQEWICNKQSIARAVVAVGRPALTALHAAKTGQPGGAVKLAKQ
jgi:UrcA family protein